ncbi:MAG TPA: hypothetical protein VG477_03870, partial [Thermoanaerobaculia bacterium]|nr:hypothetical protein [Thermoanaerobaculia bacterium]
LSGRRSGHRSMIICGVRLGGGKLWAMSERPEENDEPNLHPGPRDEGGEGGMATREFAAAEQDAEPEDD